MDFLADQLSSSRRFRLFNVIDDYSRECHVSLVDFSIGGRRVADTLDRLKERHGKPRAIVCDNGTEFTSMAMFEWANTSSWMSRRTRLNSDGPSTRPAIVS